MNCANKAIKFAPCGRRTLVPRAVYGGRSMLKEGHADNKY
jgi:hypothetical protein